jgi:predicted lactoylglutathione lyase
MAGPSKKMRVSDEVFHELLQENKYSYISERECSDSEINVKILSICEQSVSSDEAENVSDNIRPQ